MLPPPHEALLRTLQTIASLGDPGTVVGSGDYYAGKEAGYSGAAEIAKEALENYERLYGPLPEVV